MDKAERLQKLEESVAAVEAAAKDVSDAAIRARMAGASWAEIGRPLGITKQAAFLRYSRLLPYAFPAGPEND
jgi:hypothetical protein